MLASGESDVQLVGRHGWLLLPVDL